MSWTNQPFATFLIKDFFAPVLLYARWNANAILFSLSFFNDRVFSFETLMLDSLSSSQQFKFDSAHFAAFKRATLRACLLSSFVVCELLFIFIWRLFYDRRILCLLSTFWRAIRSVLLDDYIYVFMWNHEVAKFKIQNSFFFIWILNKFQEEENFLHDAKTNLFQMHQKHVLLGYYVLGFQGKMVAWLRPLG